MILCSCRAIREAHAKAAIGELNSSTITCCSLYKAAATQAGHPEGTMAECGSCTPVFKGLAQAAKGNVPLEPC